MSSRPDRRAGESGFTLLEVLVALAVTGALLAVIAPVFGGNLIQARRAESRLQLAAAARAVLEGLPARGDLRTGTMAGETDGVRWQLTVAPSRAPGLPASGRWTPYHLVLDLLAPDGQSATIETTRLGDGRTL